MRRVFCLGITIFLFASVFAQISISGAKCVVTGLVYQYDINSNWKENEKINICVDGGVLSETGTTCIETQAVPFIKVQWSEGKTTGKITISSQKGTDNINVNIALPFNAGFIETTDKQTI